MSHVPDWWEFLLLSLAAWRIYRLLAYDTILDRPRRWLARLDPAWEEGQDPNPEYRFKLGEFINCPYCLGFWVALAWWGAWLLWPHATDVTAAPFAVNAALIGAAKLDER